MAGSTNTPSEKAAASKSKSYRGPFFIMTSLFFLWGFMTVFNDILIPRFKDAFQLNFLKAMLVQSAFFGAYFIGALLYFVISITKGDPIAKIGYKNGVVVGLTISALGSFLFWPAANMESYSMFLLGLFVVGLGFAMLQIAANPYVTILGPEHTASSRLNLAQAFNSVGTTTGPLIGGYLIFQYFANSDAHGADSVKVPYLGFGIIFLILAGIFFFIRLPHIGEGKIEKGAGALRHMHVRLGVIGIFMYVGAEVAVGSAIISFLELESIAGLAESEASKFVAIYWGGALIGRFMGSVELSDLPKQRKTMLLILIPILSYLFLWAAKSAPLEAMRGSSEGSVLALWGTSMKENWANFRLFIPFVALCWLMFRLGKGMAGRSLFIFSTTAVVLLIIGVSTKGALAMWCVIAVGLFASIGWSNTFSLAIEGLGELKSQASSLLVMAILGGALLPPLQGWLADITNIQFSFIIPMLGFAYVAFYGLKGHRMGRTDLD